MNGLEVMGYEINAKTVNKSDYISLTDIAKYKNKEDTFLIINHWMRSRSTIEFLGLWEKINNPYFKPTEFGRFKNEAGGNSFMLPPQYRKNVRLYLAKIINLIYTLGVNILKH